MNIIEHIYSYDSHEEAEIYARAWRDMVAPQYKTYEVIGRNLHVAGESADHEQFVLYCDSYVDELFYDAE